MAKISSFELKKFSKKRIDMSQISHYENLPKNVLMNAYLALEKKQQKLIKKVQENDEIMEFLADKIKEALSTTRPKFVAVQDSKILQEISEDFEKNYPEKVAEIEAQVAEECGFSSEPTKVEDEQLEKELEDATSAELYEFIDKLKSKSERQLRVMLNKLEKKALKIELEISRLENKLREKIKKGHFIKDALMERWRRPSDDLLEAIEELENGGGVTCKSVQDFDKAMADCIQERSREIQERWEVR